TGISDQIARSSSRLGACVSTFPLLRGHHSGSCLSTERSVRSVRCSRASEGTPAYGDRNRQRLHSTRLTSRKFRSPPGHWSNPAGIPAESFDGHYPQRENDAFP